MTSNTNIITKGEKRSTMDLALYNYCLIYNRLLLLIYYRLLLLYKLLFDLQSKF